MCAARLRWSVVSSPWCGFDPGGLRYGGRFRLGSLLPFLGVRRLNSRVLGRLGDDDVAPSGVGVVIELECMLGANLDGEVVVSLPVEHLHEEQICASVPEQAHITCEA
jgi:hypothetical protein